MPPSQDRWRHLDYPPGPPPQKDVSSHRDHHSYLIETTSSGRSVTPHEDSKGHLPCATRTTSSSRPPGHLTETIPSGRSGPPHWTTSVPSPGHKGRLTGTAGASPIWPAGIISLPRKSSVPGAASVACGVRLRLPTRHQQSRKL